MTRPLTRAAVGVVAALLVLAAALVAVRAVGTSAGAATPSEINVAVFYDSSFTDVSSGGGGEAFNVRQTLEDQGFVVTTFVGTTTSDWTTALAGKQVVAIPELSSDLDGALDAGAKTAIHDFVNSGGRLIVFEGPSQPIDLLNDVFSFSLAGATLGSCPCTLDAVAAAGTEFEGGPTTLQSMDSMGNFSKASLPTGSKAIYVDNVQSDSVGVSRIPFGSGMIVHLGWDWFYDSGETANQPVWRQVLGEAAGAATPPPTTTTEPPTTTTTPPEPEPTPVPLKFTG